MLDDYPSAISAHSKMAVVQSALLLFLYLLWQTKIIVSFVSQSTEKHSNINCFTDFQNHSNNSVETKKTIRFKSTTLKSVVQHFTYVLYTASLVKLSRFWEINWNKPAGINGVQSRIHIIFIAYMCMFKFYYIVVIKSLSGKWNNRHSKKFKRPRNSVQIYANLGIITDSVC